MAHERLQLNLPSLPIQASMVLTWPPLPPPSVRNLWMARKRSGVMYHDV